MTSEDQKRLVLAMLEVLPVDGSLTKQDAIDCVLSLVMGVCFTVKMTPGEFAILILAESDRFDSVAASIPKPAR